MGALFLALGSSAVACAATSSDEDDTTIDAASLTTDVAVGQILVVRKRTSLRDANDDRIRRLSIGEKLVALEASPRRGEYHVRTVSDSLTGYVRGSALGLAPSAGPGSPADSGATTADAGVSDAAHSSDGGITATDSGTTPPGATAGRVYPMHTNIVATTFWVGELFNAALADGSQVCSTYDSNWAFHWSGVNTSTVPATASGCAGSIVGGCDGVKVGDQCNTETRTASNGYFPSQGSPKENPFYLDLPYDDINDSTGFSKRCTTIPWANDPGYAGHCTDQGFSYMKNRWVKITGPNGKICYGQNEDAGPSHGSLYHDAAYVFGTTNAQPVQGQFNNAGMDVSPALNGCLGFAELDGDSDHIAWQFVDDVDVPAGPWKTVVTKSQVSP